MDLQLTPQQAARYVRFKKFDNAQDALTKAKEEAKSSREALYYALSAAYYWYLQINHDFTFLLDELSKNQPEIKWLGKPEDPKNPVMPWDAVKPDDPNIPRDPFTPIVKLVFGYADRKYASTVSNYAKCLRFVDREVHDDAKYNAIYDQHLSNPELAKNLIEAAGGIMACVEEQHKFENPKPEKDASQEERENFWRKECDQIYADRKPMNTVSLKTDTPVGNYVLMMGRVSDGGNVEIVETLQRPSSEIFSIAQSEAFQDVSTLDPALNLFADSIGFMNVFRPNERPVFSVEKNGAALHLSLDHTHSASIVVKVEPKEKTFLAGFSNRAYLEPQDCEWFKANAQEHKYRRIYTLQQATVQGTVSAFELESRITQAKKTLHFNNMAKNAEKQVVLDATISVNWDYEIELERKDLTHLYLGWCQQWLAEFKDLKKRKAADRVITVSVTDKGLSLSSKFAISAGEVALKTGLSESVNIPVSGHELLSVFMQLLACPNFDVFKLRGLETGVIEVEAEDSLAKYTIDLPMLINDGSRYVEKHFAKLK